MGRFNIDDIRQEFQALNWQLLSESYQNLDSELSATCPHGHEIITTYRKWRDKHLCPVCSNSAVMVLENHTVRLKEPNVIRVLAIDDATEYSGWALFDDNKLVATGLLHMEQSDVVARISSLRQWLLSAIELWKPNYVAIEDIQLQNFKGEDNYSNVKTFKVLAQLQGVLINTLFESKVSYIVVHSKTWRSYCGITAKTRSDMKRAARLKVLDWYKIQVNEDIADAVCIGKYVANKYLRNNQMMPGGEEL